MSTATRTVNITEILNGLIETAKDGQEGFRQAAEKAQSGALKALFAKYSAQRGSYALELQTLVASLGEEPATSGHVSATLHRGWIGLKTALSSNEDKALIEEAEAGEDAAVKAYTEALGISLPTTVDTVVRRQFAGIREAHNTIRDLKHGNASTTTTAI